MIDGLGGCDSRGLIGQADGLWNSLRVTFGSWVLLLVLGLIVLKPAGLPLRSSASVPNRAVSFFQYLAALSLRRLAKLFRQR